MRMDERSLTSLPEDLREGPVQNGAELDSEDTHFESRFMNDETDARFVLPVLNCLTHSRPQTPFETSLVAIDK